jgi:hypothetical protein
MVMMTKTSHASIFEQKGQRLKLLALIIHRTSSFLLKSNDTMLLCSPQACLGGRSNKISDQAVTTLLAAGFIAFFLRLIITRQTNWDDCEYDS